MSDNDAALQDYLTLRAQSSSALLATKAPDGAPHASYAPLLWRDDCCYLFLSQLASHTRNLDADPSISLMLLQPEQEAANAFARQRITLRGRADVIPRDAKRFSLVLSDFHRLFGGVMSIIEPLPDFKLFGVRLESGQFVRGFGQAFELSGAGLDQLNHIVPK